MVELEAKSILDSFAAKAGFKRGCVAIDAWRITEDGIVYPMHELQVIDFPFNHPLSSSSCWIKIESQHEDGSKEARWLASHKWRLLLKKCIEEVEAGHDIKVGCDGYCLGSKTLLAVDNYEELKMLDELYTDYEEDKQ